MMIVSEPKTPVSLQQDPVKENASLGSSTQASLYIRNIDSSVTETDLSNLFGKVGTVLSVKICTDIIRNVPLGYGYVNYSDSKDAKNAMDLFNGELLKGQPIQIMFSNQDPSSQKVGASIFVKLLSSNVSTKEFHEIFSYFGGVLSCTFPTESKRDLKMHGCVQFEQEEDAQQAISTLDGMAIKDGGVFVRHFLSKEERQKKKKERRLRAQIISKLEKVYVRNLPEEVKTNEELKEYFSCAGRVLSASIVMSKKNYPRGFGFVRYGDADSGVWAVNLLDGSSWYGNTLSLAYAKSKSERVAEFELKKNRKFKKLRVGKLFVLNIDDSINDEKLKELFSQFGEITMCKMKELDGKMIGRKPLYVWLQSRKEDDVIDVWRPPININYGGVILS